MTTSRTARGTFDVEMTPSAEPVSGIAPMSLTKRFAGELEGTSTGLLLAVHTETEGSAAYVAMELVTGTLEGRRGSFTLQHFGTMNRGVDELRVQVVPDSATGDLAGLCGQMKLERTSDGHRYVFDYALPS